MTTKITIDAHAGWPVSVTIIDQLAGGADSVGETQRRVEIVQPGEVRDFFVFDTRSLMVREMKRDELKGEQP